MCYNVRASGQIGKTARTVDYRMPAHPQIIVSIQHSFDTIYTTEFLKKYC